MFSTFLSILRAILSVKGVTAHRVAVWGGHPSGGVGGGVRAAGAEGQGTEVCTVAVRRERTDLGALLNPNILLIRSNLL